MLSNNDNVDSGVKVVSKHLASLEGLTASSLSAKETRSRVASLFKISDMTDNRDPRNNQVCTNNEKDNLNINLSGDNHTVFDGKKSPDPSPSFSTQDGMEFEMARRATFNTWPHSAPISAGALARAGFYYTGTEDMTKCFACRGQIKNWAHGDTAMGEHKRIFPSCPFVLDINYKNVPLPLSNVRSGGATADPVEKRAQEKAAELAKMSPSQTRKSGKNVKKNTSKLNENRVKKDGKSRPEPLDDASTEVEMKLTLQSEYKRLLSFQNWPRTSPMEPRDLAKAGFYYLEKEDIVQCFACFGKIKAWEPRDVPMQEHKRHFPSCPFVKGLDVKNKPITQLQSANALDYNYREPSEYGATVQNLSRQIDVDLPQTARVMSDWTPTPSHHRDPKQPKFSDFAGQNARLATFDAGWPRVLGITPLQLAKAGFFYTGENDNTKCFYCGGGLRDWVTTDEPWTEHAKWFPLCEWLLQQRGQTFVNYVVRNFPVDRQIMAELQSAHNRQAQINETGSTARLRPPSAPLASRSASSASASAPLASHSASSASAAQDPVEQEAAVRVKNQTVDNQLTDLEQAMASDLTRTVLEMGYDRSLVKRIQQRRLQRAGREFPSSMELLDAIWTSEGKEEEEGAGHEVETRDPHERRGRDDELGGLLGALTNMKVEDKVWENVAWGEHAQSPADIEREIERLRDEKMCKVCMDEEANTVLIPCTHLVVCDNCAKNLNMCPICRRTIESIVRVFKS